jgi:LPS sulfotransferase NodH
MPLSGANEISGDGAAWRLFQKSFTRRPKWRGLWFNLPIAATVFYSSQIWSADKVRKQECVIDFLVASLQRTGSGYLCELLRQAGKTGRVGEYLNPQYLDQIMRDHGIGCRDAALRAIGKESRGQARGVKLHFEDFRRLLREFSLEELLPEKIIFVTREDRLAQAVSLARARETGAWTSKQKIVAAPVYRYVAVAQAMREINEQVIQWQTLFQVTGRKPIQFTYEEICEDPQGAVGSALAYLGIDEERPVDATATERQVQRDDLNAEWQEQFRRDYLAEELGLARNRAT